MAPSSRSPTPPSTKRLLHELKAQTQDPAPFLLFLRPISESQILNWEAVMKGVPGTAYEGIPPLPSSPSKTILAPRIQADPPLFSQPAGLWHLALTLPPAYPLNPPTITFTTPICHPNVHFRTGEICLDLLKTSWTPAYTLAKTLEAIYQLLAYPEVDSPLNVDVAGLLREGDRVGAEGLVRFWCGEKRWEG